MKNTKCSDVKSLTLFDSSSRMLKYEVIKLYFIYQFWQELLLLRGHPKNLKRNVSNVAL